MGDKFSTVVKMVENIEEIGAYVKVRTKLSHSVVYIFTELGNGSDKVLVSFETVREKKKLSDCHRVVKDATKYGRSVTVTGKVMAGVHDS